ALAEHVDELTVVGRQHDGIAADHEVRGGDVGLHLLAEVGEHLPHRLELEAVVQEGLDHAELEQVLVAVPAAAAATARVGDRRTDQVGAGPVVELPVGDADDLGGLTAAVVPADAHVDSVPPNWTAAGATV